MKIELSELTTALNMIKAFAQDTKNVPGILLRISESALELCYSDIKKSIVKTLDIDRTEETEKGFTGEIIVPYSVFIGIIDACQSSGMISTEEFNIEIKEDKLIVTATKCVTIEGTEDGEYDKKVVSKFWQDTKYYKCDEDMRYAVLTRMKYESIFDGEEWDIWNRAELINILSRTAKEDGKTIYFSRNTKSAFVVNLASLTYINTACINDFGFTVTTKVARYLVDILSKLGDENLRLSVVDSRFCRIVTDDDTFGVWFEMAPVSKMDPITLQRYEEKKYESYKLTFNRYALDNVLTCATAFDKSEKTMLTFAQGESGALYAKIVADKASNSNMFYVVAEDFKDNTGDLLKLVLPISVKVLIDLLHNCTEGYIMLDIDSGDSGRALRLTDTSGRDENGNPIVHTVHYTLSTK